MIEARGLTVVYPGGTVALRNVDVDIPRGALTVLVGPSGGGKSTLLRCFNGSVRPVSGTVAVDGTVVNRARRAELVALRRKVAFIPQQFNLVKRSSVLDNVLAGRLGRVGVAAGLFSLYSRDDRTIAWHNIERMNLGDKARRRVDTLSGGEQQRVAIGRSLTQQPRVVLADEPVSNLDYSLAARIMDIFRAINEQDGITVVVALHGLHLVGTYADHIVALDQGSVVYSGASAGMTFEDLQRLVRATDRVPP